MSTGDIFKKSFLEGYASGELTTTTILACLLIAGLLGVYIFFAYRFLCRKAFFNKNFSISLIGIAEITAAIILTVQSNVVISLGMVGALSIVRFRTAVKEPMDTIFMFWAIVAGIITGAGYVPVAIIATLLIGILFLVLSFAGVRLHSSAYLAVVRYEAAADATISDALRLLPKYKLRSKNMVGDAFEMVLELKLTEAQMKQVEALRSVEGVQEVDLLSYNGGTTL